MQWNSLKKNIGYRVRLEPTAKRFDSSGRELEKIDDDWLIQSVNEAEETVRLSNIRTNHCVDLAKDHIHHFTSDTTRPNSDIKYGFLTLLIQISIKGNNIDIRPTLRPGEPVESPETKAGYLSQEKLNELGQLTQQFRQSIDDFVLERASDNSRSHVMTVNNAIKDWLTNNLGVAYAEAFVSATPFNQVPVNFPYKYGGLFQHMKGRLTFLSNIISKFTR